jgi:hypothetical protein
MLISFAGRFLQADPEELPYPRRQIEGCNIAGQTSWSKALVRHGADARVALAGVLRVSAGDIQVRDRPD